MKRVDELDRFLRKQKSEGKAHAEGAFSISKEKALEKLSAFQLPFEGAWALKLVQFAVASKTCTSIVVSIGRKETVFEFYGTLDFKNDLLESALLDPEFATDSGLEHLVTALRVIGFNQKRGFWLERVSEHEVLVWDGESLQRQPATGKSCALHLAITAKSSLDEGGFLDSLFGGPASHRNAEALKRLSTMAHTCPIELIVDGRKLSALEVNPTHGWSPTSQLLFLGLEKGDLPSLEIPYHTGQEFVKNSATMVEDALAVASEQSRQYQREQQSQCSAAILLAAHLKRVKSGKSYVWRETEEVSLLNWVRDGVIVQVESLGFPQGFCSAGCFLSADGLDTDLSGFSLVPSEEKMRRILECKRLLSQCIRKADQLDFVKAHKKAKQDARAVGGLMMAAGAGIGFFSFVHAAFIFGFGALVFATGDGTSKERERQVHQGLREIQWQLEDELGKSKDAPSSSFQ